jgi:hypothetical protein
MMMQQDEKIRDLIIEIFLEHEGPGNIFAEYHIHKILYQYKKNVKGEFPQLSKDLPFYWYKHGAYSQPVRKWLTILSEDKILTRSDSFGAYGNEGSLFTINKSRLSVPFHPNLKQKAIDELYGIVRSFRSLKEKLCREESHDNPGKLFNKILYEKYAPFPFQTLYNMTYLELINNISFSNKRSFKRQIAEIKSSLCECEAVLPVEEPLFNEYNELFISYVTSTNRLLRYYERDGDNYSHITSILIPMSNTVWDTFADGVRILDKGHEYESYYSDDIPAWKIKYERDLAKLGVDIDKYKTNVLDVVGEKGLTRVDDQSSREFLSTVIGGYFSKD